MATFSCPLVPPTVWFPLDPGIAELPDAPPVVVNPSPKPANTYPGTVTDEDFVLNQENYGSLGGVNCYQIDLGLITSAVTSANDYGSLATIWDLLPTDTPAIPAEEVTVAYTYPPYHEYTVQTFSTLAICEVTRVDLVTLPPLDVVCVTRTLCSVISLEIKTIICVVKTVATVDIIGGSVTCVVKTKLTLTTDSVYTSLGMLYGFEVT